MSLPYFFFLDVKSTDKNLRALSSLPTKGIRNMYNIALARVISVIKFLSEYIIALRGSSV